MTTHVNTRARRRSSIAPLVVAGGLLLTACGAEARVAASDDAPAVATQHGDHSSPNAKKNRISPATLHDEMRKLWTDHVTWTRLFLVSAIAGLPDLDATTARLLQNQEDIGAAVATFYGADAGARLTDLLR